MAENDDLLPPDELEALLSAAGLGESPSASPAASPAASPGRSPPSNPAAGDVLEPSQIDALLQQRERTRTAAPSATANPLASAGPERVLHQAEKNLAAAVAADFDFDASPSPPPDLGQFESFAFQDFGGPATAHAPALPLQALEDVELDLRIELGRTELLIDEVLKLKEGSVVPLDKLAGDPVDILVNGRLIARGEVLVLNDNFCVRVAEILSPEL